MNERASHYSGSNAKNEAAAHVYRWNFHRLTLSALCPILDARQLVDARNSFSRRSLFSHSRHLRSRRTTKLSVKRHHTVEVSEQQYLPRRDIVTAPKKPTGPTRMRVIEARRFLSGGLITFDDETPTSSGPPQIPPRSSMQWFGWT